MLYAVDDCIKELSRNCEFLPSIIYCSSQVRTICHMDDHHVLLGKQRKGSVHQEDSRIKAFLLSIHDSGVILRDTSKRSDFSAKICFAESVP